MVICFPLWPNFGVIFFSDRKYLSTYVGVFLGSHQLPTHLVFLSLREHSQVSNKYIVISVDISFCGLISILNTTMIFSI